LIKKNSNENIYFSNFFCILINTKISSQPIDTLSICFKAKILTTTRNGYFDSLSLIKELSNQKLSIIDIPIDNVIFIKIKHEQRYNMLDNSNLVLIGTCYYYLAFNLNNSKYYRLGGFDYLDLDDFFKEINILNINLLGGNNYEIDLLCLFEFSNYSNRKKKKKKFRCFENCSEEITNFLIIQNK
jgi:hypothetical protein